MKHDDSVIFYDFILGHHIKQNKKFKNRSKTSAFIISLLLKVLKKDMLTFTPLKNMRGITLEQLSILLLNQKYLTRIK